MNELEQKTISSVEVAEMVGKEHSKLLRDIRNYIEQLARSQNWLGRFFYGKQVQRCKQSGKTLLLGHKERLRVHST